VIHITPTSRNRCGGCLPLASLPFSLLPPSTPLLHSFPLPNSYAFPPFFLPLFPPLDLARRSGDYCISFPTGSGRSPVAERLLVHFEDETTHLCHAHNDTVLLYSLDVLNVAEMHKLAHSTVAKNCQESNACGVWRGRPHKLLAVSAIAPSPTV